MALIESKQKLFFDLKKPREVFIPKIAKVQDILEIRKVSKCGIFKVGDDLYSKTYLMDDINYESMSYEEQVLFYADWCKVLDSFTVAFKITIINQKRNMKMVREKILYPMKNDKFDEVREAYNDIINKKIIQDKKGIEQKKYLTITVQENKFEEVKQFFSITEPSIFSNFLKIGVNLHSLTGDERLYPLYCFYRQGEEDDYDVQIEHCIRSGIDWKNEVAPDFIRFDKDKFTSSHLCGRAMYIDPRSYGTSFEDKFLDDLTSIETCGVFSIDYVPIPRDYLKTTLENKYMAVEDKIATQQQKRNRQKNFMSDITYKVRMEKEEIENLLEETRTNNAKMLWVGVSAIITAEDEMKLEEYTTSIQKICANNSCVMKSCNYLQREGINTALPIGIRNLPFMRAMFTRMAGGFLPYKVMEAIDYDVPMYYGANSVSGNPILKNRKKLINSNGFVFGKSGSGKSFTGAKMEIGSVYVNTEDDIIIIDPQNEFEDTVKIFDGTYVNLDIKAKTYINPLHIDLEDLKTQKKLDTVIREKNQMMYSIAEQSMDGETVFGIGTIVGRCVRQLYRDIAVLPEEKRYIPLMSDFYKYIEQKLQNDFRLVWKGL